MSTHLFPCPFCGGVIFRIGLHLLLHECVRLSRSGFCQSFPFPAAEASAEAASQPPPPALIGRRQPLKIQNLAAAGGGWRSGGAAIRRRPENQRPPRTRGAAGEGAHPPARHPMPDARPPKKRRGHPHAQGRPRRARGAAELGRPPPTEKPPPARARRSWHRGRGERRPRCPGDLRPPHRR